MFSNSLGTAVNNAISQVVDNFQANPERFWNERDIHWSLFYYLKNQQVIKEAYPTELIRAEFPTLKVFPGNKPTRGHYDLVIINAVSNNNPEVQNMKAQASWDDYLKLIQIDVAIEIKIWQARINEKDAHELMDWDIKKLTDLPNNIQNAYFLNFVQLNFTSKYMMDYYSKMRGYLSSTKMKQLNLKISCVPSDRQVQPDPKDNWL